MARSPLAAASRRRAPCEARSSCARGAGLALSAAPHANGANAPAHAGGHRASGNVCVAAASPIVACGRGARSADSCLRKCALHCAALRRAERTTPHATRPLCSCPAVRPVAPQREGTGRPVARNTETVGGTRRECTRTSQLSSLRPGTHQEAGERGMRGGRRDLSARRQNKGGYLHDPAPAAWAACARGTPLSASATGVSKYTSGPGARQSAGGGSRATRTRACASVSAPEARARLQAAARSRRPPAALR